MLDTSSKIFGRKPNYMHVEEPFRQCVDLSPDMLQNLMKYDILTKILKDKNEPPHDKTNKMTVCPAKTQISLGIRPVWSESSLCAQWVAKDPSFLHADSEDSDQTGRMPKLIWVFAGRIIILLVLSWGGSNVGFIQRCKLRMNSYQRSKEVSLSRLLFPMKMVFPHIFRREFNVRFQALLLSVHKYMAIWDTYTHNYKTYYRGIRKSMFLREVNMWILQAWTVFYNILYFNRNRNQEGKN